MRQRSCPAVPDDPAVVENLLKLGGSGTALSGFQVCLPAYIRRIEAGNIGNENNLPQLDGRSGLQGSQGSSWVLFIQRQLRLNCGKPERLHLRVQWESFPQVLGQGFGSRRITLHGKRKRGFDLDVLTRGNKLQSLCR